MARLVDPVVVGKRTAPSRVLFGPHVTNLGDGRGLSPRHTAYYEARAAGGAGVVIVETASVHPSDWPYERAPLAEHCRQGWAAVAEACRPHGTLVLAGLGHAGAQGSSAYSQSVMWAPSGVADVVSREMPAVMEQEDIDATVAAFGDAAALAIAAGLDGVEIDAGPLSLLRQFHSGLTNLRNDAYGEDRLRFSREILDSVRARAGSEAVVVLRLCCDELAPWAGVTPEQAAGQVAELAERVDAVVVVRGGPYSTSAYRPDAHTPSAFNRGLCRAMREAAAGNTAIVLQGSVVEVAEAQAALDDGVADLVEMTRAQIAEPRLVGLVRAGVAHRARPCVLCNQACQVRDVRNPVVSCIGEPRSGHETEEPSPSPASGPRRDVLVVGGGVAGLECARVLALAGHRVRAAERRPRCGGALAVAAVGSGRERLGLFPAWLLAECLAEGATVESGVEITPEDLDTARANGVEVVLATGSRPRPLAVPVDGSCTVVDPLDLLADGAKRLAAGPVVVHDPAGGPVGVGVAEWLAASGVTVSLVTPDPIAGSLLGPTGDLAEANARLQRAGVSRELRSVLRGARDGQAFLEDRWSGETRTIECAAIVDCSQRLPEESLYRSRPGTPRAGDCVAPRGVLDAVLEGRRLALRIATGGEAPPVPVAVRAGR